MRHPSSGESNGGRTDAPSSDEPRVDPLSEALATTWWGPDPWRRYLRLLAFLGPALLLERVAAVTNFSRTDSWVIINSLDLGQWLQVLTGSFVAWHPWSLMVLATGLATFGAWSFTTASFAVGVQELRRGSAVVIADYGQLGAFAATAFVPLLVALVASGMLPRPLALVPLLGVFAGWLTASERLTDAYRLARQEYASRKMGRDRGGSLGDLFPYVSSLRLRVRAGLLEKVVSWLFLLGMVATVVVVGLVVTSRTPWVPEACITYDSGGGTVRVDGYLLVEGQSRDVVLRADDRKVFLSAGVTDVSVKSQHNC